MRILLIAVVLTFVSLPLLAQEQTARRELEEVENKIHQLNESKQNLRSEIRKIDQKVDSLREVMNGLARDTLSGSDVYGCVIERHATLFSEPSISGDIIRNLPPTDTVEILGAAANIINKQSWKVVHDGDVGYIARDEIYSEEAWMKFTDGKPEDIQYEVDCESLEEKFPTLVASNEEEGNSEAGEEEQSAQERWVGVFTANVRSGPSTSNEIKHQLEQGEKVEILNRDNDWCRVRYSTGRFQWESDTKRGWVSCDLLSEETVDKLSPDERRRRSFVRENSGLSERQRRAILEGKIYIGMSKEMARASWGRPSDVNRTIRQNYVKEQWVYSRYRDRSYVYFRDGTVSTIQN